MIGMGNSQRIFSPLMTRVLVSTLVNWELPKSLAKCSKPHHSLAAMALQGSPAAKIL